ncbi:MAG: hypothetical protein J2P29_02805 [Actinobacteria bacterium]|nr:hypothetical protein [Actinomycetota bacterium]
MNSELHPGEAAEALAEIQKRQQQVIDRAIVPAWYWWAVGVLMVVLAIGVDTRTHVALGITIPVFVVGMLAATGAAVRSQVFDARVRDTLLDGRGVMAILGFVAVIVGCTLGIAFGLRAAGASYPATIGCAVGGLAMGLGGPVLNRVLRRIMMANRAGLR